MIPHLPLTLIDDHQALIDQLALTPFVDRDTSRFPARNGRALLRVDAHAHALQRLDTLTRLCLSIQPSKHFNLLREAQLLYAASGARR
jgi:hypothetical protein